MSGLVTSANMQKDINKLPLYIDNISALLIERS